ncbi:hypothetical protein [Nonomuraea dietziae]|uniref:hypothetical protein n=1 Tax=Nonomuraea dietziae TaxID=65515 RepID=UPI0031DADFE9
MIGRTYLERGQPVTVLVRWGPRRRTRQRAHPPRQRRPRGAPLPRAAPTQDHHQETPDV